MTQLLQLFIVLPLVGFIAAMLLPRKSERLISTVAISTIALHFFAIAAFIVVWLVEGYHVLDSKHIVFFDNGNIEIFIDFYFDATTAVFALTGSVISLLVAIFSRYYLHRDQGFKRFFCTSLLFFLAYNLVVFAGNFETLFIGWEILGICSFILIAFYRDRYLPVKNSMKVISIYRLGDICLILAMWMSHHLWHQNITFAQFNDVSLVTAHIQENSGYAFFIFLVILVAAAVKSAQMPFSSWLPRAMEGPTTSSAIFYGSLSVHLGVFLLIRTYPYWENIEWAKPMVIALGLITSFIAAAIARVQSSVKTQIAYSSITQIGLIFIEVALGFHTLALIHFAANAFLRTYQLLVSPSVLSYLIHDMVFNFKKTNSPASNGFFQKILNTIYILSIKEWNNDRFLYRFLWSPFKWIGKKTSFLNSRLSIVLMVAVFAGGIYFYFFEQQRPGVMADYLTAIFSVVGLLLILSSFAGRGSALRSWIFVVAGQLFFTLSVGMAYDTFSYQYMLIYLSGIAVCFFAGYICLSIIQKKETNISLHNFHGHSYEHGVLSFIFFVACLGVAGLPFTPSFIGMDVMFSQVGKQDVFLAVVIALSFLFIELAVLRIYARIFLGQHKKAYHPIAYRSS